MEGLEAKHGARDPLYETVVLFHYIVEVFDLATFNVSVQLTERLRL